MKRFAVQVQPGELHFNAAHFISFNGVCENLHGHNFHVRVEARGGNTDDALVIDFVRLTRLAADICAELHDGVLLPELSYDISLSQSDGMIAVESHGKRFILPEESCIRLPIPNTTAEMLAAYINERLLDKLAGAPGASHLESLEVAVEEADGQWGLCVRELPSGI